MSSFTSSATLHPEGILIVHPLDRPAEAKIDLSTLGRMPMTRAVRFSLMALRAYLILMSLLVAWNVFSQAWPG